MALDGRVRDTVQALSEIADYLAGVPGRKSLIWVTAGFPSLVGEHRYVAVRAVDPYASGAG